jgi:hypothetical protein
MTESLAPLWSLGSFSHSLDQLRERPNLTKTKMCTAIESGQTCPEGDKCPFAHCISELRATPMLFRTVLCNWWRKGQCEFGDNCRFAHGEEQLRSSSPSLSPSVNASLSNVSSTGHSLNQLSTNSTTPSSSVIGRTGTPVETPEEMRPSDFVTPSPMYAAIFTAALSAATTAAMRNGVFVLTPQQTAAVAAAAAAAANEALKQYKDLECPEDVQPRTSSAPVVNEAALMRNELKKFKKGFSSSPALLSVLGTEVEDEQFISDLMPADDAFARPRADSEPSLKVTERLMEEIRKLWILPEDDVEGSMVQMGDSLPLLSASHVTLEGFHINLD